MFETYKRNFEVWQYTQIHLMKSFKCTNLTFLEKEREILDSLKAEQFFEPTT